MHDETALVPFEQPPDAQLAARARPYMPPVPGRSWRTAGRFAALMGGSAAIGVGVAAGLVSMPMAGVLAVGLATAQVLGQTVRLNRLGQSVVGGIQLGDLDAALAAAELALRDSPGGVMRTLAASNLASVLLQRDDVEAAVRVLDRHPPRWLHMPLSTVLWLNNRAFAHLVHEPGDVDAARTLLDDAEARLLKARPRELGGPHNARKLTSALAGTRALERVLSRDGNAALASLRSSQEHEDGPPSTFRIVERDLCRGAALRLVGRRDEATLTIESLHGVKMTPRQRRRMEALEVELELRDASESDASSATAPSSSSSTQ